MLADPSFRRSHFSALPSTKHGRLSVGLFLGGLAVFLANLLVALITSGASRPSVAIGAVLLVAFTGAVVAGAVALIWRHERSWAVWIATVLPIVVLAADVVAGLLGLGA